MNDKTVRKAGQRFLSATENLCNWLNGVDLSADHAESQPADYQELCDSMVAFRDALQSQQTQGDAFKQKALEVVSAIRSVNREGQHIVRIEGDEDPCYWQREEWIDWMLDLAFELELEANASAPPAPAAVPQSWCTLEELPAGSIFETQDGVQAVKSEYRYSNSNPQPQCVSLASGEYAHFKDKADTLVRPVTSPAPATSPDHTGDTCDRCERVYTCVYNVPDDVWPKIAPRPETLGEHNYGGGLLCPDCAATETKRLGVRLIFEGKEWEEFPKPAPAAVPEGQKRYKAQYYSKSNHDWYDEGTGPYCALQARAKHAHIEWRFVPVPPAPAAVPEGWKLVPKHATPEMLKVGVSAQVEDFLPASQEDKLLKAQQVWKAMIYKSPTPAEPDSTEAEE